MSVKLKLKAPPFAWLHPHHFEILKQDLKIFQPVTNKKNHEAFKLIFIFHKMFVIFIIFVSSINNLLIQKHWFIEYYKLLNLTDNIRSDLILDS